MESENLYYTALIEFIEGMVSLMSAGLCLGVWIYPLSTMDDNIIFLAQNLFVVFILLGFYIIGHSIKLFKKYNEQVSRTKESN